VIAWHKEGLRVADIARKTGFDRQFINRWISKLENGEAIEDTKRSGRPRKRSANVERQIEKEIKGKRRRSSRVVARDLKRRKVADLSYTTVQRAAHDRGLRPYRCTKMY
jgi:transposase